MPLKLLRCRHHQKTARLPVQPMSKPSPIAVPFLRPINVARGHSCSSLNRGPFCLFFLCSLVSFYLTVPYATRSFRDLPTILQRAYVGQPTLTLIQHTYPPVTLKNHTIRLSDTRLNLRYFACR